MFDDFRECFRRVIEIDRLPTIIVNGAGQ